VLKELKISHQNYAYIQYTELHTNRLLNSESTDIMSFAPTSKICLYCTSVHETRNHSLYILKQFVMMQQHLVGRGLLTVQSSQSHSVGSSGRVNSPIQRPLHDNTQHSQETTMSSVGFEPTIPATSTADRLLKANSHIPCRYHAVALPCRSAKGLDCVFLI
jgi:hypothetical protein